MTLPRFAGQVTHDLLAGYDPADILADVAHVAEHGDWSDIPTPKWWLAMLDGPAIPQTWLEVHAWLLDMALAGKIPTEVEK